MTDSKAKNNAAQKHAKEVLGREQFATNKDAVKSIGDDFKAGWVAAKIHTAVEAATLAPSPAQPAHSGPTPGAAGGAVDA